MQAMIRKSWLRKVDRSPSKSPTKVSSPSVSPRHEGSLSPERLLLRHKLQKADLE